MGVFTETGVETYKAGPIARTLVTTPSLRDNITTMFVAYSGFLPRL